MILSPSPSDIQAALLARAAAALPAHLALVDELATLLGLSRDSAYRRLRGDTALSLQETQQICRHFGVSLEGLLELDGNAVTFHRDGGPAMEMVDRLQLVHAFLFTLEQAQDREIVYFSMELPFFHILQVPDLLAFKLQYWQSMAHPEEPLPRIALDLAPQGDLHHEIINLYLRIPSTEIIYEAALSTTMMQILYFLESGCFVHAADALRLFDALHALVAHLKAQAILGRKFRFGAPAPEQGPVDTYKLYHNEMVYSQNIVYTRADGQEQVFLEHNVINFLRTTDPQFCAETRDTLATIQRKSIPISTVSERERNKFFHRLEASVARQRSRAEMILAGV